MQPHACCVCVPVRSWLLPFGSIAVAYAADSLPLLSLVQVKHEQDSLQGIVHQLPEYIGSASNPLLVRPHTAPAATGRTAAAAAAVEASGYSFCSRPHSPEVAARVQTARNLDSSLAIGSLEPLVDEAAEEAERQRQSLLGMMLAEHQARLLAADQLANQMVKLYPHGVPVSAIASHVFFNLSQLGCLMQ